MHRFDFISGAPKTFIFQKDSNKTNLGGLLTLVFIIIIILIINSYLYGYFANDKYKVTYSYDDVFYPDDKLNEIYEDENLYPKLNFSLELFGNIKNNIRIVSLDRNGNSYEIPIGEEYTTIRRVSDLNFYIFYRCQNNNNCTLREEDYDSETDYDDKNYFNIFNLRFKYNGYYTDHQNPESPIKRDTDHEEFPFTVEDRVDYYKFGWKIIKYSEENSISGMFRQTKVYTGGFFTRPVKYSIPNVKIPLTPVNGEYYQIVSLIAFNRNNFGYYDIYSRQRISIFDPIANICALITTLYGVIAFIFCGFYSNSFDNYKIIQKIISSKSNLHSKIEPKINRGGEVELTDIHEDNNKDTLLTVNDYKDDKIEIRDNNYNDYIKERNNFDESKPIFDLPKFHFYDFFYNDIYSEKCCNSPTQDIISTWNDLITKYYSIDAVIYNQLRLENLFKDYKWNNPKLKSIENNGLIMKIKGLFGK